MKNIVNLLKEQHTSLISLSEGVMSLKNRKDVDCSQLYAHLLEFKYLLKEHLELENNIFYPKLLEKIQENNIDEYHDTKDFIEEMKDIELMVNDFLGKYTDSSAIERRKDAFFEGFDQIIGVLALRISSEENGVYLLW